MLPILKQTLYGPESEPSLPDIGGGCGVGGGGGGCGEGEVEEYQVQARVNMKLKATHKGADWCKVDTLYLLMDSDYCKHANHCNKDMLLQLKDYSTPASHM